MKITTVVLALQGTNFHQTNLYRDFSDLKASCRFSLRGRRVKYQYGARKKSEEREGGRHAMVKTV